MTASEIIYGAALVFYMQALPLKLIAISTAVNILVLAGKIFWKYLGGDSSI